MQVDGYAALWKRDRAYPGLYAVGGDNSVYLGMDEALYSKIACSEAQPIE